MRSVTAERVFEPVRLWTPLLRGARVGFDVERWWILWKDSVAKPGVDCLDGHELERKPESSSSEDEAGLL